MDSQYINPELLNAAVPFSSKQQLHHHQLHAQHLHQQQQQQHQQAHSDLFSFNTSDIDGIFAPHPDLFESELDNSLAGFDPIHFVTVDHDYTFLRSNDATGPPSTITVSSASESVYDSHFGSVHTESIYNYPETNYSLPLDFTMDFNDGLDLTDTRRLGIDSHRQYAELQSLQPTATGISYHHNSSVYSDSGSDSSLSHSPVAPYSFDGPDYYSQQSMQTQHSASYNADGSIISFNDVQPQQPSAVGAGLVLPLLSPFSTEDASSANTTIASQSDHTLSETSEDNRSSESQDPKRKYECSSCGKSFARQYNLKTHMDTHNPQRVKPFVCTVGKCLRSFSRKHDLGRHMVSIHRDAQEDSSSSSPSASSGSSSEDNEEKKFPVGVGAKSSRERCETCGGSKTKGGKTTCGCAPVK